MSARYRAAVTAPADVPLEPEEVEVAAKVAGIFRWLAESEFPGYSPLYEHLALRIADELWIPAFISRHTRSSYAAILFFACVRDLTLTEPDLPLAKRYAEITAGADPLVPDPWPLFRELVVERRDDLGRRLDTRTVQTNEVGRSAALLPAFDVISRRFDCRPLHLIEIGCSAGLNLGFDHYEITYSAPGDADSPWTVGAVGSPVSLTCDLSGDVRPHLPTNAPEVASRLGLDLAPVDVTDADAMRWLEACIWPDMPQRVSRFRAAVELARADPPEVRRGNAVDLVADAIRALPADGVACLDSTWVLAYFSPEDRAELARLLDDLGADRAIGYVTAEYESTVPWLPPPRRPSVGTVHGRPTLLGLGIWDHGRTEHRALAWMQPHGQWLDWLDGSLM